MPGAAMVSERTAKNVLTLRPDQRDPDPRESTNSVAAATTGDEAGETDERDAARSGHRIGIDLARDMPGHLVKLGVSL